MSRRLAVLLGAVGVGAARARRARRRHGRRRRVGVRVAAALHQDLALHGLGQLRPDGGVHAGGRGPVVALLARDGRRRGRRGAGAQVEAVEAPALLLRRRRRRLGGRRRGDGQPEEVEGARWLRHGREHRRRIGRRLEQAGHSGRRRRWGRRVERARHLGLWL